MMSPCGSRFESWELPDARWPPSLTAVDGSATTPARYRNREANPGRAAGCAHKLLSHGGFGRRTPVEAVPPGHERPSRYFVEIRNGVPSVAKPPTELHPSRS